MQFRLLDSALRKITIYDLLPSGTPPSVEPSGVQCFEESKSVGGC